MRYGNGLGHNAWMLSWTSVAVLLFLTGQAPPPSVSAAPQRVFDTRQNGFVDFETMLADLARADAVFVGEQHDDPNTHRLELAIVEGLTRRAVPVVVAMEMFERDVQENLDRYAAGAISEEQFLEASRPWPRYATDYRPILEFARANHLPIVASNVPRRVASDVSKTGLAALDALGAERRLAARELQCPVSGSYFDRFAAAMGNHAGASPNFYFAQCVKDETMGESVADMFHKTPGRVAIVHFDGAFHSDFGEGTADSARRRMPGRRIAVVSILPVADLDAARPADADLKRADYLIYTVGRK
jgi:uncharacterized iron-regulated protein